MTANDPVCRFCGSENLGSVEQTVTWRPVNFVRGEAGGWERGDDWGEDGDGDGESIGVVCLDCQHASESDTAEADIITTRAAFTRAHPPRDWWVMVMRYKSPGREDREEARRRVRARTPREAADRASQMGMQAGGAYPWRAVDHWTYAQLLYPGDPLSPTRHTWPVGDPRPAAKA